MSAPGYHTLKQERGDSPGSVEMAEMKPGSGGASGASVADDAPRQATRVDTSESNDDEATTKHKDALSKDELRALLARKPTLDDLFFDLLFAAALSVYNSNVALDSISQVAGYMGIFALLWWSWWTQVMYDVRFRTGKDMRFSLKIAHRIVRAALLGIWLAFSTTSSEFARQSFTNFSTIYALSRAVLAIDELLIVIETARDCDIFQRPGQHRRRAYRTFWKRTTPHWLCITANIVALILWVTSRFEAGDEGLSGAQLGMWMAGIGFELVVRVFIEATDMLPPLMNTSIAERVSLLLLIIFGEAFQGIGTALNNISPGGRDWERGGIPSGGWGTHTIIQAVATLVIILLLFHSYYKGTAVGGEVRSAEIENTSIVVFIWGTLHLILHLASAVIVVGMRKITLFINTIEAADRFLSSPQEYVPQTPDWSSFTSDKVVGLFADSIPSVSNITDYYERSLVSMLSVIIGSNGAQIPQVDTADGIVNATLLLSSNNVTIPSSISSQLGQFPVIQQQAIITDSLDVYAGKQIFQYKYVYLSAAIYLFSDVVLKAIQGLSLIRERDLGLIGNLAIRFVFAVVLALIQIVYIKSDGPPTTATLYGGLAICAALLCVELLIQLIFERYTEKRKGRLTTFRLR